MGEDVLLIFMYLAPSTFIPDAKLACSFSFQLILLGFQWLEGGYWARSINVFGQVGAENSEW